MRSGMEVLLFLDDRKLRYYMDLFDILGPVMVGPSSSHTAGAVKIGNVAKELLKEEPTEVKILLHGSFADTGKGHGTDKALIAGWLGLKEDDPQIPNSFELAKKREMKFSFHETKMKDAHPNTAVLFLKGKSGNEIKVQASSTGGGRILINKIDDIDVNFTAEKPTLIVHNLDQPGHVAEVTSMLSHKSVNIATMQLYRDRRGGKAVMVIETDESIPEDSIVWLAHLEGVYRVTYINF